MIRGLVRATYAPRVARSPDRRTAGLPAPGPIPPTLETDIRLIPGVVGSGLFIGMADTVLVGDDGDFRLTAERRRNN